MLSFKDLLINSDLGSLNNRQPITTVDSSLMSLPTSPASSITAGGLSLSVGDRVLFTALTNPAENNMIYKVEQHGVAGNPMLELYLVLDQSGLNPSGAPTKGDFCLVQAGSLIDNIMGWNGFSWSAVNFLNGTYLNVAYQPANPYAVGLVDQLLVLNVDNQVVNLPPATGSGRAISMVVKSPSTVVNVYPSGTDTINGTAGNFQIFIGNPAAKLADVAPGMWLTIV
jgi:hypothetical protein